MEDGIHTRKSRGERGGDKDEGIYWKKETEVDQ